ncbi:MAG: DnaJ domain-containing protein [Candidatus Brocadiaceae bacterium]|nr:DnaJ domain-containing protein [Candidatus Brocadiaceae bacterium]
MKDYYEVLDISPQASEKDIKKRFRFLSHAYHPDKFATFEQKQQAEELFKLKSEAYNVLSVKERRKSYDKQMNKGRRFSDAKNNDVSDTNGFAYSTKTSKSRKRMYFIGFGILAIIAAGVIINRSPQGRGTKSGLVSDSVSTSLAHPKDSLTGTPVVSNSLYSLRDTFLNPHKEAAVKYLKDAEHGSASIQNGLGYMYYMGQGVDQDYKEATKWYQRAAAQKYAQAQFNLGVMYSKGQGVSVDFTKAVKWYRMAAEQKYARAQNSLGLMYSKGQGVKQDYEEAVKWYRMAAEQGYTQAQKNLSVMYLEGRGVEKDHKEAVKWQLKVIEKH